jgi:L-lactate dehydrogenase complex protein LldG
MKEAMQSLRNRYGRNLPSMISFVTGPSRTQDLPNTNPETMPEMVVGAHGPIELILFLIDDRKQD